MDYTLSGAALAAAGWGVISGLTDRFVSSYFFEEGKRSTSPEVKASLENRITLQLKAHIAQLSVEL